MAPIEGTFSAKQVYPLFVPLYFGFAPDVYLYVYISLCLLDIKESEWMLSKEKIKNRGDNFYQNVICVCFQE